MENQSGQNSISVIVPAYNVEGFLPRTLNSILEQTIRNIEIIVIDDGSTDRTFQIIENYKKKYPNIIRGIHTDNYGVTSARLTGIKMAKGDYIGFVDSDDIIENDMYELLLGNAQKYQADISHCGYQMIFPDDRIRYFYNSGQIMIQNNRKGIQDLLSGSLIEPGLCNKLYKRELFKSFIEDELMDVSIKINEDLLMNFYLFSVAKRSVFQDVCKYHYIVRHTSASRQKLNEYKIYDPIKVKEIIIRKITPDLIPNAKNAYIRTCISTYNTLILSKMPEDKKRVQALIKKCRKDNRILGRKYRLVLNLIIFIPFVYEKVYKVYSQIFMKKKYE